MLEHLLGFCVHVVGWRVYWDAFSIFIHINERKVASEVLKIGIANPYIYIYWFIYRGVGNCNASYTNLTDINTWMHILHSVVRCTVYGIWTIFFIHNELMRVIQFISLFNDSIRLYYSICNVKILIFVFLSEMTLLFIGECIENTSPMWPTLALSTIKWMRSILFFYVCLHKTKCTSDYILHRQLFFHASSLIVCEIRSQNNRIGGCIVHNERLHCSHASCFRYSYPSCDEIVPFSK